MPVRVGMVISHKIKARVVKSQSYGRDIPGADDAVGQKTNMHVF